MPNKVQCTTDWCFHRRRGYCTRDGIIDGVPCTDLSVDITDYSAREKRKGEKKQREIKRDIV
jgi:hypothetical protein